MKCRVAGAGFALGSAVILSGCGGASPGAVAAPAPPKLDPGVCNAKTEARPLVVEQDSAWRGRLESLARDRVIPVRYVGCDLEVLPSCRIKGSYKWTNVSRKHDHVSIHNLDELYTQIPFGAAHLEGSLKSAGELDVDMTVAGRFEADRGQFREDELSGDCDGATHVITAMTAGAFRLAQGSSGDVSGSGGAFGASAGGSSSSATKVLNEDGTESLCTSSSSGSAPPDGCSALMRLELVALQEGKPCPPHRVWNGTACESQIQCPRGTAAIFGSCASDGEKNDGVSNACLSGDLVTCEHECNAGNGASCADLAYRSIGGDGVPKDLSKAGLFDRKSCDAGDQYGCAALSYFYFFGSGGLPLDTQKSLVLATRACDAGQAYACGVESVLVYKGIGVARDEAKGLKLAETACDGGNAYGCMIASIGHYTTKDAVQSVSLASRACELGEPEGCYQVAGAFKNGFGGMSVDPRQAMAYARRSCDGGFAAACAYLSYAYGMGTGVPTDLPRALLLGKAACNGGSRAGCRAVGQIYEQAPAPVKDLHKAATWYARACDGPPNAGSVVMPDQGDGADSCQDLRRLRAQGQ